MGADMLAFPTFYYYETMGTVLLEAMQAGVPVVTTRRASIPEIVHDGEHGLLVNEQDAADLAEKILRLAGDPALRAKMGAAGGNASTVTTRTKNTVNRLPSSKGSPRDRVCFKIISAPSRCLHSATAPRRPSNPIQVSVALRYTDHGQ